MLIFHEGHCEGGACNTTCIKEAAAKISAIRKKCMISDVLFKSFGFLKFWLNNKGVVVVVSVEIAWSLRSYSWYLDFTKAPRDSCQAVLAAVSSWGKSLCHIFSNAESSWAWLPIKVNPNFSSYLSFYGEKIRVAVNLVLNVSGNKIFRRKFTQPGLCSVENATQRAPCPLEHLT